MLIGDVVSIIKNGHITPNVTAINIQSKNEQVAGHPAASRAHSTY